MNKTEAQRRVDRIRAFREELATLGEEGVVALSDSFREKLGNYHEKLLADLVGSYDVDTSYSQKQMALGMRIVSFLGSVAISAAVFFFFHRFWGGLTTTVQVAILVVGPILATLLVEFSARREKTLYFAALAGLVAFSCFVLNLNLFGRIFNITPSQNAFLVWAAFAFVLAYGYHLRLLLVAGMLSIMGYLAATVGTWSGCYWLSFGERPENFIIAGLLLFLVPFMRKHEKFPDFPPMYRLFGLLPVFIAILILSNWGYISYLTMDPDTIEVTYQTLGFLVAGGVIWLGIRRQWSGMTNLGSTFFTIYLYTKLFDWWWDWMPKYLFFLLLGLLAILLLVVLKRLRQQGVEVES